MKSVTQRSFKPNEAACFKLCIKNDTGDDMESKDLEGYKMPDTLG